MKSMIERAQEKRRVEFEFKVDPNFSKLSRKDQDLYIDSLTYEEKWNNRMFFMTGESVEWNNGKG